MSDASEAYKQFLAETRKRSNEKTDDFPWLYADEVSTFVHGRIAEHIRLRQREINRQILQTFLLTPEETESLQEKLKSTSDSGPQ